jgi:predicted enzyme related to lactoylglutathione lyase
MVHAFEGDMISAAIAKAEKAVAGNFSTRFTGLIGVQPSVYRRVVRREAGGQIGQESRSASPSLSVSVSVMDIKIYATFLPHDDPDASVAFYRDILGFEVRSDVGSGKMRWITVGPAEQPGTSIVLHPPAVGDDFSDDQRRAIAEMMAKGTYGNIVLATADLDGTFKQLKASGAEVVQEPTDQPYGIRDCGFRDPAGNNVRINEVS